MILMTFDEILTYICDSFDAIIAPRKIARTNTNIIYLLFKAFSKGLEVINSICVTLNNKFNPESCTVEDLNSVAKMVGTEKLKGSGSGLPIIATNTTSANITLLAGTYYYRLDEDTRFAFELLSDTVVPANNYELFIAMSEEVGSYPVTAQAQIEVTADVSLPAGIEFSCDGNASLLGTANETDLAFRERILKQNDTQDSIKELETQLRNLPYIFDCCIKFNNTILSIVYDSIIIPPFTAYICFSGSPRSEMAGIIANKLICPTIQEAGAVALDYISPAFVEGKHTFYINPFKKTEFDISIIREVDTMYLSEYEADTAMERAIREYYRLGVHRDYVKEDDIYNIINSLNLNGLNVLTVNLIVNNVQVDFVSIPVSRVPSVGHIGFHREGE